MPTSLSIDPLVCWRNHTRSRENSLACRRKRFRVTKHRFRRISAIYADTILLFFFARETKSEGSEREKQKESRLYICALESMQGFKTFRCFHEGIPSRAKGYAILWNANKDESYTHRQKFRHIPRFPTVISLPIFPLCQSCA